MNTTLTPLLSIAFVLLATRLDTVAPVHPVGTLVWDGARQVRRYSRLTSLSVQEKALTTLENVQPGDCVVCFNKNDIYSVSRAIGESGCHAPGSEAYLTLSIICGGNEIILIRL